MRIRVFKGCEMLLRYKRCWRTISQRPPPSALHAISLGVSWLAAATHCTPRPGHSLPANWTRRNVSSCVELCRVRMEVLSGPTQLVVDHNMMKHPATWGSREKLSSGRTRTCVCIIILPRKLARRAMRFWREQSARSSSTCVQCIYCDASQVVSVRVRFDFDDSCRLN